MICVLFTKKEVLYYIAFIILKETILMLYGILEMTKRSKDKYETVIPWVVRRGLSYIQADKHGITISHHRQQCIPCIY